MSIVAIASKEQDLRSIYCETDDLTGSLALRAELQEDLKVESELTAWRYCLY